MNKNQLKQGVMLSYLSLFMGNLISIVYTPVMLRLLGKSEFGLYTLANSVIGYLGLLSFGFSGAYIRYFSRFKAENNKKGISVLNGLFISVFLLAGALALIFGCVLASNSSVLFGSKLSGGELGRIKIIMYMLAVNLAVSLPSGLFSSYVTAHERYIFQKTVNLIKIVVNPFVTLPVLLLGCGSVGFTAVSVVLSLALELANIVFCFKRLKMKFSFRFTREDFALLKEIAVFSSFIFINIIVDQINWNVDKFLLGIYKGTGDVAVYGLAAQLNSYYLNLAVTISAVFAPRINMLAAKGNDGEINSLFRSVGRLQFAVLSFALIGFAFLGRAFISFWAGEGYGETYAIFLILSIPVTVSLIQNLGIEILRAKNLHRFRSLAYLVIALLNIGASIPLCKVAGGTGCALGTAAAFVIGNGFIMNCYYGRRAGLDILKFWREIAGFFPALAAAAGGALLLRLVISVEKPVGFIVFGVLFSLIFAACMWLFGLNEYEKALISKPLAKIFGRLRT